MNVMYYKFKTLKRGFTDAEFNAMVEKVSGIRFTDFWAKYVNGTVPVDYAKYYAYGGIEVVNDLSLIHI